MDSIHRMNDCWYQCCCPKTDSFLFGFSRIDFLLLIPIVIPHVLHYVLPFYSINSVIVWYIYVPRILSNFSRLMFFCAGFFKVDLPYVVFNPQSRFNRNLGRAVAVLDLAFFWLIISYIYGDESKSLGSKHVRGSAENDQPSMGRYFCAPMILPRPTPLICQFPNWHCHKIWRYDVSVAILNHPPILPSISGKKQQSMWVVYCFTNNSPLVLTLQSPSLAVKDGDIRNIRIDIRYDLHIPNV